jgi:preprotein translocase subunit SecA
MSIFSKLFGDANEKTVKQLQSQVDQINALEPKFEKFSDTDLQEKTKKWQEELKDKDFEEQQKILNNLLPEAFASVREAAKRTLLQRHYDVQCVASIIFHQGSIAEMKTGEGKTLASTLTIYLNALTGRGVHVITVNDYLSRRDMVWMGQVYSFLGLSVGCLNHEVAYIYDKGKKSEKLDEERDEEGNFNVVEDFLQEVPRQEAYAADITYGTNNEFGFDYLRDNMVQELGQKVQRELHYAIVDEVDSILIDEARTPLIISAPDTSPTKKYLEFSRLVAGLKEGDDYNIDEKMRAASLTEEGITKLEKQLGVENIYTDRGMRDVHHIEQALKANVLFTKEKDYVIKDGEIVIVDEFTGRLMFGRRYSDGLHQAIEAKEGVEVKQESITMATVTFQNYFRMYKKLAGMTGTAATEGEEFAKIYGLEVIVVPTNREIIREDRTDTILKSEEEKYGAIVQEIKLRNELGQPVLVGTISIQHNEHLSELLKREGVEHKVLNAKYHEKEGEIIAQAGKKGAVTIATNMAGRGVDIVLGGNPSTEQEQEEVKKIGGLVVIGTERHESRRIDNQLRGRAGRQGDPGSSQFFVSMEDDLMRIFGGEKMKGLMNTIGVPEGMPIENKLISNQIEKSQTRVEGRNFDIRKHLVEYDDVINAHRETIYKKRNEILGIDKDKKEVSQDRLKEIALEYIKNEINTVVKFHTQVEDESQWNLDEIYEVMDTIFPVPLEVRINIEDIKDKKIEEQDNSARGKMAAYLYNLAVEKYAELEVRINSDENIKKQMVDVKEPLRMIERTLLLRSIDMLWVEHIDAMDGMRQGIGLRGYGQKDPLVEYKKEAHRMFQELLANIRKQVVYSIYKVGMVPTDDKSRQQAQNSQMSFSGPAKTGDTSSTIQGSKSAPIKKKEEKIGRNDPCHCGSGKKFKKCHGA